MFNPHPPLTGFPLVLITLVLAAELFAVVLKQEQDISRARWFARVCLLICAVITPLTYYSGYWGAEYANRAFEVPQEIIASHQSSAKLFLILLYSTLMLALVDSTASANAGYNKSFFRWAYLLLLSASFACVAYTSSLGGELVFQYGAHVSPQTD